MLDPIWIFLLLAVVSASGIAAGLFGDEAPKSLASRGRAASENGCQQQTFPERETVYAARQKFDPI